MEHVVLITMPISALNAPSIALTQLKAVLDEQFHDRISVEILYLNHDFARYLVGGDHQQRSNELYLSVLSSLEANNTGLADWLFRQVAFPHVSDNSKEYFMRYYPRQDTAARQLRRSLLKKRAGLDGLLDGLIDRYKIAEAGIVGFTSMFSQNVASFAMAKKLKERNPQLITVIGGANCENPMGQEIAKNVDQIDYVFSGPALKSFPQFVQTYLDRKMEHSHQLKGVFSKRNVENGTPGLIGEELDVDVQIPLNYDDFFRAFERTPTNGGLVPKLFFETSRGCWWGERAHCTFCGLNGMTMNYRAMSPGNALKQFESLFSRYADRCSYFESVDNILPRSYLREVFPALQPPPGTTIFYEVKADLTEQELATLAQAGVREIQPGIESLATSTLKLMRKGTTCFVNLQFLKNCLRLGIEPKWNLLVGFPGEGEDVYRRYIQELPLLTHLQPPSGVYPVRFDRYSPYFVEAEKYGLDLHPYDYYNLIYPFGDEALNKLAYYFMDQNYESDYFTVMVDWIGKVREKVDAWRCRWNGQRDAAPAQLCLAKEDDSVVVHDSRQAQSIQHPLTEAARQILELLNKPKRMKDLTSQLSGLPLETAEKEISFLRSRGLVMQEGEQIMSLVMPFEQA